MRMGTGTLVVVLLACGLHAVAAAENLRKANSVERIARFECRLTNAADREQDVTVYLPLPQSNARQEVSVVHPSPGYKEILTDAYGNRIACYVEKGMKPGEMRCRGWMAAVRTWATASLPTTRPAELDAEQRDRYTRDSPKYQVTSQPVRELKDELVRGNASDADQAFACFSYLVTHITYVRDDKWDAASDVLRKKQGSCSEYSYTLLGLLRAAGIPCRYTGGFIVSLANKTKYDEKVHEDSVFHRWVEIHLQDYGWLPADASRGQGDAKRFGNYLDFWGRVPADSLQVYTGDGGADSLLEWDYVAHATGTIEGGLKATSVCYWIEAPLGDLDAAVNEVSGALGEGGSRFSPAGLVTNTLKRETLFLLIGRVDRSRYPELIEALYAVRHPSAVHLSVLCDHQGMKLPSFLEFPLMVDEYLRGEILKYRRGGKWEWGGLERWWRKARPEISFSEEKKVFVLNKRNIELN
ncbi:MAG TPA: transglutaminase-like domain-containing protein [Phycisphaerae bacterium]|nr:transglutaminase-like domain-containing protein [Phycisphaerae bacterium]HRY68124.1 transglutaminase-like domain-containing protein [Phycisphaerae bacterium]HSA28793.1 transglutaminase-like domain-containing protein [Phycisphaerae bacterium]